jgi:hypothetical protein
MENIGSWYENLSRGQQYWVRNITPEILATSIIIDFEGPKDGPPEFVGVWYQGKFETIFFSEVFESCQTYYPNLKVQSLDEFGKWIEGKILEGYKIIAYSTLEGTVLIPLVSNDDISYWYRDAHKYFKFHSKMWRGVRRPRPFTLSSVLDRLGIEERQYGNQQASQRIRYVKEQLIRRGDYNDLTPTAKAKLTKVIRYNEDDVCCLRKALMASFQI